MDGDGVAIREEGHIALGFGQADKQCAIAMGCIGAAGKSAKNLLVVGVLKVRPFSPVSGKRW